MKKFIMTNSIMSLILLFTFVTILSSCGIEYTPEQQKYISSIEKMRQEKDDFMKNNKRSPFNIDSNAVFHNLNYYPVDPNYVFKSKLYKYAEQDTIEIFGTKGEARKTVRFGYIKFKFDGKDYNMDVYQGSTKKGNVYYSIWFTDKTTGEETYGVGRYLDFELNDDENYVYTIDFNLAYNPYCSYSAKYSCAVPTKDDFIEMYVYAGEKNFH